MESVHTQSANTQPARTPSSRIKYPDYFSSLQDDGKSVFYIISKEPGYYKFGITTTLLTRMRTHYRDFQFERIDAIIDCGCDAVMRAVETEFKQEAAKRQLLVTKYSKTEVIAVPDIKPYLLWVKERVATLLKLPQPQNNRIDAKKDKKYKAEIELLTRLHEQDQTEIAVLREKIKTLEELLAMRE